MRALILAAGKGKRLGCEGQALPKVLHPLRGKPLIRYVTEKLTWIPKEDIYLIVGYQKEAVMAEMPGFSYVEQQEQLGTGHAVRCAREAFAGYEGDVLVLYGDMPLFREETYRNLVQRHRESGAAVTVLTCDSRDRKMPYGRVLRDADGNFLDVVEERDCTEEQKLLTELNVGVYVFQSKPLFDCLEELRCDNAQGEYYLTDLPKIMQRRGYSLTTYTTSDTTEILGVNTKEDLRLCESLLD